MVRKKVEGNEEQRRAAAREARAAGAAPSAWRVTTGASKQRGWDSVPQEEHGEPPAMREDQVSSRRGRPGYTDRHERVFQAVAETERQHGQGSYVEETALVAGLSPEETRTLLRDLVTVHRLVTQLAGADEPDLGPRFETKSRL